MPHSAVAPAGYSVTEKPGAGRQKTRPWTLTGPRRASLSSVLQQTRVSERRQGCEGPRTRAGGHRGCSQSVRRQDPWDRAMEVEADTEGRQGEGEAPGQDHVRLKQEGPPSCTPCPCTSPPAVLPTLPRGEEMLGQVHTLGAWGPVRSCEAPRGVGRSPG